MREKQLTSSMAKWFVPLTKHHYRDGQASTPCLMKKYQMFKAWVTFQLLTHRLLNIPPLNESDNDEVSDDGDLEDIDDL